ncbi:MAG TPA: Stf0 family sulfotransferase [Aquihabitans sp.]|nr:Stf0 family sulfotransferase [Aquihabitans sp.]
MDAQATRPDPIELLPTPPADGWSLVTDEDYDLAGPEHDAPAAVSAPLRTYVLCSSPRSGSTLLSEALAFLGCAGTPIEYFDPTNAMGVVWARWGCRTLDEYVDCLHRRRASPSGLFGTKLHWFQLVALHRARTGASTRALSLDELGDTFRRVGPDAAVVRVLREDRQRQALSWARAEQTGCWYTKAGQAPPPVPEVSDVEHRHYLDRLEEEESSWAALLDHLGVEPLVVRYEDLRDDHAGTVAAVARHIGCPVAADAVPEPRLVRQSR